MKFRVAFTLDIPPSSMSKMMELAQAYNYDEVRSFLKAEANDYLWEYLDSNGVIGVVIKMEGEDMTWT